MPTIKKGIARVYGYEEKANKDQINGYPSLDAGGKVPVVELPDLGGYYLPLGKMIGTVRSQSTDVIVTANDYLLNISTISGLRTCLFPAATENTGQIYVIRKNSSDTNLVWIESTTGALINGLAQYVLNKPWQAVAIQFVGPDWVVPYVPTFLQLYDVGAASYTGQGLKHVRVNSLASSLEFVTPTFLLLNDTPSSYAAADKDKFVKVNTGATGLTFSTEKASVQSISASTTINIGTGIVYVDASGGAVIATLNDTDYAIAGREITIIKSDSSLNAVTISTSTNKNINGYLNPTLDVQWQSMTLVYNGTIYVIT